MGRYGNRDVQGGGGVEGEDGTQVGGVEGEQDGVGWQEETLAGHKGQVRGRAGEDGEGGGETSCMAGGNHRIETD